MNINSDAKGKAGERELARELTEMFGRKVFRSQQYCGANHDADLLGLPGVHIECKRVESMNLHRWIAQAERDASALDVPIVCHRKNDALWLVSLRLDDLPKLVEALAELLEATQEPDV